MFDLFSFHSGSVRLLNSRDYLNALCVWLPSEELEVGAKVVGMVVWGLQKPMGPISKSSLKSHRVMVSR